MRSIMLLGCVAVVGCGSRTPPPVAPADPEARPMTPAAVPDSAWMWMYVFDGRHGAAVGERLAGRPHTTWEYRVDRVAPVRGTPGVAVEPGATLVRVEVNAAWPAGDPAPLFRGVVRHHDYTSRADREALAGSRPPPPAGPDTVAVLIPVRKSAAWWALPQDERAAHFRERAGHPGHTAIGAGYADRVYRKLYHTRYAVETPDHDFLTYFEFERAHEPAFDALLAKLRDPAVNPEWGYVDREYEVRMTRTR
ncbi:MAG: hypothetical protein C0501_14070 [Isosphaera sp.]|nr:hypothetical protein [Isosphaera sp.]